MFGQFTEDTTSFTTLRTALINEQIAICRICLEDSDPRHLLKPCKCKGTQAYVHEYCLNMWLKQKQDRICETCMNQYEMEYKCLKPFREWTWPRPTSDYWEDEVDFACSFIWVLIASHVLHAWLSGNVVDFHERLYSVFGSRRLVVFWWFSFFVNSIYYECVLINVFRRWWNENSLYTWKREAHASDDDGIQHFSITDSWTSPNN